MGSFDECQRSFAEREAGLDEYRRSLGERLGERQCGRGKRQSGVGRERQAGAG